MSKKPNRLYAEKHWLKFHVFGYVCECVAVFSYVGVGAFCVMLSCEWIQFSSQSVRSVLCVKDRRENYHMSVCQRVVILMLVLL